MVSLLPSALGVPEIDRLPPEMVSMPVMFSVPPDVHGAAGAIKSPDELPAMVSVPPLSTVMVPPEILLVSSRMSLSAVASPSMLSPLVMAVPGELSCQAAAFDDDGLIVGDGVVGQRQAAGHVERAAWRRW